MLDARDPKDWNWLIIQTALKSCSARRRMW